MSKQGISGLSFSSLGAVNNLYVAGVVIHMRLNPAVGAVAAEPLR